MLFFRAAPQSESSAQLTAKGPDNGAPNDNIYTSIIVPLLAGGAATAIGDLAVHPMDTLKTLQQA